MQCIIYISYSDSFYFRPVKSLIGRKYLSAAHNFYSGSGSEVTFKCINSPNFRSSTTYIIYYVPTHLSSNEKTSIRVLIKTCTSMWSGLRQFLDDTEDLLRYKVLSLQILKITPVGYVIGHNKFTKISRVLNNNILTNRLGSEWKM